MVGVNAKIFTACEANRTLPLVGAIARAATETWKRLETAKRALRKASARRPAVDASGSALATALADDRIKGDIRGLERELDEHRRELEELGCYLRDAEKGLVDFPAFVAGELAYLCWFPGEATVSHYHGMREGYVARKPIPPEGVVMGNA